MNDCPFLISVPIVQTRRSIISRLDYHEKVRRIGNSLYVSRCRYVNACWQVNTQTFAISINTALARARPHDLRNHSNFTKRLVQVVLRRVLRSQEPVCLSSAKENRVNGHNKPQNYDPIAYYRQQLTSCHQSGRDEESYDNENNIEKTKTSRPITSPLLCPLTSSCSFACLQVDLKERRNSS